VLAGAAILSKVERTAKAPKSAKGFGSSYETEQENLALLAAWPLVPNDDADDFRRMI
jgi:hypothetical protein